MPYSYPDPNNADNVLAHTEVGRRHLYMEQLETQLSRSQQALIDLVKQCLHNTPGRRPSSEELLGGVHAIREEVEELYGGKAAKLFDVGKVLLAKEIKMKERRREVKKLESCFILRLEQCMKTRSLPKDNHLSS